MWQCRRASSLSAPSLAISVQNGRMAKLLYVTNVSVDGYIEDAQGRFDWTEPSDEVFAFITDLVRPFGTYVYGRRLYEAMSVWETDPALARQSEHFADFAAVWSAADKIVCSTTLDDVTTVRTRVARSFDADEIGTLKAAASRDLMVGGANLAAHAYRAGLVDEQHLFVHPVVAGGGKSGLPAGLRMPLELLDERRFENGIVYIRHRVGPVTAA